MKIQVERVEMLNIPNGHAKARATLVFDDTVRVFPFTVWDGTNEMFVSFPSSPGKRGVEGLLSASTFLPGKEGSENPLAGITEDLQKEIQAKVLAEYRRQAGVA